MPSIARSVASLRIIGDELLPEEISRLVGGSPTVAQKKGDVVRNPGSSVERVARFGMWLRKARERKPEDLDSQVEELLEGLTSDMAVWTDITARFRAAGNSSAHPEVKTKDPDQFPGRFLPELLAFDRRS